MYNMSVINPAYVGSRSDLSMGVLGRKQWVDFNGAPETQSFFANARLIDGLAMGVSVLHDKIGLAEETSFTTDVSYTVVTTPHTRLALGLKAGFSNFSNNLSQGITPDGDINPDLTGAYPNMGFGAFYYTRHFYAGLSVPQIFKTPKFRLDHDEYQTELTKEANYFATAGYVFEINENIKLKPSTFIKLTQSLPLSVDVNTSILIYNKLEFGASYRWNDSFSALAAIRVANQFRIGYTYDHTTTDLGNFNSGSHEIMLLFDFDFQKKGRWLNDSSCYF